MQPEGSFVHPLFLLPTVATQMLSRERPTSKNTKAPCVVVLLGFEDIIASKGSV